LVLFSYLSNATLRTDWNWNVEEEVEGVGDTWDIGSEREFSGMIRKWVVYKKERGCQAVAISALVYVRGRLGSLIRVIVLYAPSLIRPYA
jgi:hypothetical protein